MARIIKRICFMTIVFLVAISIKVYANELTIDCQDSINPETENTLECVLKGNFTDNVNSIKVRYTLPAGVEFQGFTPAEGWNLEQGGTAATTGLILRKENGDVDGQIEFGKFTFSVPSTYNKNTIALKIYELDATNTSCKIIEFSKDEVTKSVQVKKQNDDNQTDTQDDKDKPSDDNNNNDGNNNNNGGNEEQGNNNSNTPTGSEDDKDKNGEHGENTNANSNDKDDKDKNGSNDTNSNIGSTSTGSKNVDNNLKSKSATEKDTTVTKKPFGQYGNGKIIMISIVIVSGIGFIVYKRFKKVKFIK